MHLTERAEPFPLFSDSVAVSRHELLRRGFLEVFADGNKGDLHPLRQ